MKYLILDIEENAFSRPSSVRPGNRGFRQKPATPLEGARPAAPDKTFLFTPGPALY